MGNCIVIAAVTRNRMLLKTRHDAQIDHVAACLDA
jgi:hypothetical protein